MISKKDIKLIKSLGQKKYRQQLGLFVVEGKKAIDEFLDSDFELDRLFATAPIFDMGFTQITSKELVKISQLKTPNNALAMFRIPEIKVERVKGLALALDTIRDPGNLGTIIRLCDWYGIENLICSKTTVDCYNPKVVQATMGSLTRVKLQYLDLEDYLQASNLEIFGTFMDGTNIYTKTLPEQGIIVMGNEANGISERIGKLIDKKLSIPRFGTYKATESLNVAMATAVILSEFKRGQPVSK